MKIGILTAARTNNNGTDLQAFAMQKIFSQYGDDTEIINYKCEKLENSRKLFPKVSIKGLLNIPFRYQNHKNHENFRRKYFRYSSCVFDKTNICDVSYDLLVAGSDQIWNLKITGDDLSFFFPFQTTAKKASYAASIGRTDIQEWNEQYRLDHMLNGFEHVSVRECSGVEALRSIGIAARADLDPLLMINRKTWESIAEEPKGIKAYIFVYAVDRAQETLEKAKQIASENNYEVIFCANTLRIIPGVKVLRCPSIPQWLGYLKNAELVMTNSYHGLSFAINFQKNFVLYWLEKQIESNTRLENVLGLAGIDMLSEGMVYDPNWECVEEALAMARKSSEEYIRTLVKK